MRIDLDLSEEYQTQKLSTTSESAHFLELIHPRSILWELRPVRSLLSQTHSLLSEITSISSIMSIPESIFNFCGCFFEKGAISATKWLKKLKHELRLFKEGGVISSNRFIDSVNFLLTDDAAEWAETNMNAVRLLTEENFIADTIASFKTLFQERFPVRIVKSSAINFHTELEDFRQGQDEIIGFYHKRLLNLMARVAVKDRPATRRLSFLKEVTLREIIKAFVRSLHDVDVRRKTIRDLITCDRFLRELMIIAKNADRSKKEMKKLIDEKNRSIELEFYRDFIAKAMPKEKIEFMLTQYRTGHVMNNSFERPVTALFTLMTVPVSVLIHVLISISLSSADSFQVSATSQKSVLLKDFTGNQTFLTRFFNQGNR